VADTEHVHHDWRLVLTCALSPALRAMSPVWAPSGHGVHTMAAKGAPEAAMNLCHIDDSQKVRIAGVVDEPATEGLRVLAVACIASERRLRIMQALTARGETVG